MPEVKRYFRSDIAAGLHPMDTTIFVPARDYDALLAKYAAAERLARAEKSLRQILNSVHDSRYKQHLDNARQERLEAEAAYLAAGGVL